MTTSRLHDENRLPEAPSQRLLVAIPALDEEPSIAGVISPAEVLI